MFFYIICMCKNYKKLIFVVVLLQNFALEGKEEVGSFQLKQGDNQFCLKTPGKL